MLWPVYRVRERVQAARSASRTRAAARQSGPPGAFAALGASRRRRARAPTRLLPAIMSPTGRLRLIRRRKRAVLGHGPFSRRYFRSRPPRFVLLDSRPVPFSSVQFRSVLFSSSRHHRPALARARRKPTPRSAAVVALHQAAEAALLHQRTFGEISAVLKPDALALTQGRKDARVGRDGNERVRHRRATARGWQGAGS